MNSDEVYSRAIDTFGAQFQMGKAKEECTEFVLACLQYEQGRVTIQAVIDEAADAIITLRQARLILGPELVDAAIDRKIARLVRTIAAERSRGKTR